MITAARNLNNNIKLKIQFYCSITGDKPHEIYNFADEVADPYNVLLPNDKLAIMLNVVNDLLKGIHNNS